MHFVILTQSKDFHKKYWLVHYVDYVDDDRHKFTEVFCSLNPYSRISSGDAKLYITLNEQSSTYSNRGKCFPANLAIDCNWDDTESEPQLKLAHTGERPARLGSLLKVYRIVLKAGTFLQGEDIPVSTREEC